MANKFQSHSLKKRFERENPGLGCDLVDFSVTCRDEDYDENIEALKLENPQYGWGEKEDFDSYARDHLESEASKMGLSVTIRESSKTVREPSTAEFLETIAEDIRRLPIMLVSQKGWGKSSLVKRVVEYCRKRHPDIVWKVFDPSTSWYHKAPIKHRQTVTSSKIMSGEVVNLDDCVYEIGALGKEERKRFVSSIIKTDYRLRYQAQLKYGSANPIPTICYIFEESESYFGSYALRSNDPETDVLRDYITIGRNMGGGGGMTGILIATAETGEISPTLRRRVNRIYGKVNLNDLTESKKVDSTLPDKIKKLRKYSFIYVGDRAIGPITLEDTVRQTPRDYEKPQPKTDYGIKVILSRSDAPQNYETPNTVETPTTKIQITQPTPPQPKQQTQGQWLTQFIIGASIMLMFILYLRGL